MTLLRILGGVALMAIGTVFVIKSEWLLRNFGTVAWAEEHLGFEGGSRLFYKLLGVLVAIIGILMATGLLGGLLLATVGRLFLPPGAQPQ